MEKVGDFLRGLDLQYLGRGNHKIVFEEVIKLKEEKKVYVLDVRTKEEYECMRFAFAKHIPLNELPDRLSEIPKDKIIAIFCTSSTRATMAYTYLQVSGYDNAKIFTNSISQMADFFKPGYVLANQENLKG